MPTFEPVDHDPWAEDAPPASGPLRLTVRPRRDDDGQGVPGVADPGNDPTAAALAEYVRQTQGAAPGFTHEAERPNPALPYLEASKRFGQHFIDAAMAGPKLMSDVYHGDVDPMSYEGVGRATDVTLSTLTGGATGASRHAASEVGQALLSPQVRGAIAGTGGAGLAGAALLAPSNGPAEGAETHFNMVPDENVRKGLDAQWDQKIYRVANGKRVVDRDAMDARNQKLLANATADQAARSAADADRRNSAQAEADAAKLKAGQASDRFKAWQDSNAETLADYKEHNPARLAEYNAARGLSTDDTILMQRDVLNKHALEDQAKAKEDAKENQPLVKRYPWTGYALEGAALAAGGLGPMSSMLKRAGTMKGLVRDSEHAIRTGAPEAERMILQNKLAAAQKLPAVNKKEMASMLLAPPFINTAVPMGFDLAHFQDFQHPALKEDWDSAFPYNEKGWSESGLKRTGLNLLEGLGAPAVSYGLASGVLGPLLGRDFEALHGQSGAALKSLEDYKAIAAAGGGHQAALTASQAEAAGHAAHAQQLQQTLDDMMAKQQASIDKGLETKRKNREAKNTVGTAKKVLGSLIEENAKKAGKAKRRTKPSDVIAPSARGPLNAPENR